MQPGLIGGLALSDESQPILALGAESANKANRNAEFLSYVFALAFLNQPGVRNAHKFPNIELMELAPSVFVAHSALKWLILFLLFCQNFLLIFLNSRLHQIVIDWSWKCWYFSRVTN